MNLRKIVKMTSYFRLLFFTECLDDGHVLQDGDHREDHQQPADVAQHLQEALSDGLPVLRLVRAPERGQRHGGQLLVHALHQAEEAVAGREEGGRGAEDNDHGVARNGEEPEDLGQDRAESGWAGGSLASRNAAFVSFFWPLDVRQFLS